MLPIQLESITVTETLLYRANFPVEYDEHYPPALVITKFHLKVSLKP